MNIIDIYEICKEKFIGWLDKQCYNSYISLFPFTMWGKLHKQIMVYYDTNMKVTGLSNTEIEELAKEYTYGYINLFWIPLSIMIGLIGIIVGCLGIIIGCFI